MCSSEAQAVGPVKARAGAGAGAAAAICPGQTRGAAGGTRRRTRDRPTQPSTPRLSPGAQSKSTSREQNRTDATFWEESASRSRAFRNRVKCNQRIAGHTADLKPKELKLPGPMKRNLAKMSRKDELKQHGVCTLPAGPEAPRGVSLTSECWNSSGFGPVPAFS